MNIRNLGILSIVTVAACAVAVVVAVQALRPGGGPLRAAAVGGPFTLLDQDGRTRSDADFRGRLMLVFFGYTHCPDVCPTALNDMALALDGLGDAAARVQPIFITIDPARDTPARLKSYAANFHPRLIALTGSEDAVAAAARAYRVYRAKAGDADATEDYLMDHSSIVYLMAADGSYLAHFGIGTPPAKMAARIRDHLATDGGARR